MSIDREQGGKVFREAWIEGVTTHYAGTPKDSFITPWEQLPEWQQRTDIGIFEAVERDVAGAEAFPTQS
ncbi:hypothetical protein [Nocardia sp. N2S4-5]|uniref:hypothetical protein n=1 Tax=Nocardia sp. N2S4-5 TaxID=3351565 RepID=UPI0037CEB004